MLISFGERMPRGSTNFFGWLLAQAKILTADKLLKSHWPCNPICVLCDQHPETVVHLTLPTGGNCACKANPKSRGVPWLLSFYTLHGIFGRSEIFEGKSSTPATIFTLTKEEMALRKAARGHPWR
ncbi:hypothetical protein U9M48_041071, partial [Paspalum notatum var. saurae]